MCHSKIENKVFHPGPMLEILRDGIGIYKKRFDSLKFVLSRHSLAQDESAGIFVSSKMRQQVFQKSTKPSGIKLCPLCKSPCRSISKF